MTGRGAGWCAGYDRPGFSNPMPGRGLGLGTGYRGGGRGRRNMFYATGMPGWARAGYAPPAPPAGSELTALQAEAAALAERLDAIKARIEALGGHGFEPAGL